MKKDKRLRANVWILLLALAVTVPAWGGLGACMPNPATVTLSTLLPTSSANGCFSSDLTFSNFANGTDFGQTINGVAINGIAPDGTTMLTSVTPPSASGINVGLPPAPTDTLELTSPFAACKSNSGSSGWCINATDGYLNQTVSYNIGIAPGDTLHYLGLDVTITSHSSGQGGAIAAFFEEVCVDATNTNFATTGTCTNGTYYVMQAGGLIGKFQSDVPYNLSVGVGNLTSADTIQIRDTVYLTTTGASGTFADVGFADLTDTPEPSTFILMGAALTGIVAFRFRRRRLQP